MASSFKSDERNDFIIKNGEFEIITDAEQTIQNIRERLLSYLGDYFLDLEHGVPYYQTIFTKPFNLTNVENIIKSKVLEDEDVTEFAQFTTTFDPERRSLSISMVVNTVYGSTVEVAFNV